MAIVLKSTSKVAFQGLRALVYGESGAGKTTLVGTAPNPIILSAEAGLLCLAGKEIPFIEIKSLADLMEAYSWVTGSDEAKQFETVALDSISEIAEIVLSAELKKSKDGRAAYGEMNNSVSDLVRAYRDIPGKNVVFTAKREKVQDENGRIMYGPSMPGKTLSQGIAYHFDLVLALRVEKDAEGKPVRALMTDSDGLWTAKDRSGKLDFWEAPDLGAIIKKVKS